MLPFRDTRMIKKIQDKLTGKTTPSILQSLKGQYAMLFILAFIWGSSFILMKKGLQSFSANLVAGLRIFITFLFFLPFTIRILHKLTKRNLKFLLVVGFIGNGAPAILFTTGQTEISSSLAGILNSLTPLFTLLVGISLFKTSTGWKNILGVIIGLSGTIGLILNGEGLFLTGNLWFALFIVVATVCYAVSTNIIKEQLNELDGFSVAALSFFLIGPWAGAYLLFSDISESFAAPGAYANFGFIVLLAFFSSFLAVILFNMLIKFTTSLFATSVTYIIPVFAIFWGLADGEKIRLGQFIWIAVILFGIYMVNQKIKKNLT